MASVKNIMVDLQNEILRGVHSFEGIAKIYNVPQSWVDLALGEVLEQIHYEDGCIWHSSDQYAGNWDDIPYDA
jgi:hypothetical protein